MRWCAGYHVGSHEFLTNTLSQQSVVRIRCEVSVNESVYIS